MTDIPPPETLAMALFDLRKHAGHVPDQTLQWDELSDAQRDLLREEIATNISGGQLTQRNDLGKLVDTLSDLSKKFKLSFKDGQPTVKVRAKF